MNTKNTISISEARKNIFEIANDVQSPSNIYTLTENGRPKVVLMSADEFESWKETLEVTSDFPNLKQDIKKFEKDFKSKKYKNYVSLNDIIKKQNK